MTDVETPLVKDNNKMEEIKPLTAFDDPSAFTVKHPLQRGWTLWFFNSSQKTTQANWSDNLKQVMTVSTVEDFWGCVALSCCCLVLPGWFR